MLSDITSQSLFGLAVLLPSVSVWSCLCVKRGPFSLQLRHSFIKVILKYLLVGIHDGAGCYLSN